MHMFRALLWFFIAVAATNAQDGGATAANWSHYAGTQFAWRYSSLSQVNTSNVKWLTPVWIFQTGDYSEGLLSTPLVIDGVMYVITPKAWVYALDAVTGRLIWEYHYSRSNAYLPGSFTDYTQNRGVAVADGRVFFGTSDSLLIALDQKTGREIWRVRVDDAKQCGCNIPAAPLIVKDKVVVGETGGDAAHRGYLTAFSTKTGKLAWRWYVIPGPGEKGNETWKGDSWKYGGGAPWMTGSFDAELNLVYWGTGNAAGDLNQGPRVNAGADKRKDVNLYTASVVALDADTGALRWYNQEVPADVWDFDSAYEAILVDRQIRGRERKLLVHMNKSGVTFVLDRATGEVLNAFDVTEVRNWITGVTEDGRLLARKEPEMGKTTNICPSVAGAKSWNSMAYSPRTGFLYVPVNEICNDLTPAETEAQEGKVFVSGTWQFNRPPDRTTFAHVDAIDAITGKRAWSFPYKYVLLASMLATAGDLVFTGTPEGEFFALDARSGSKLWSFQTGAGHRGSAIAYAFNGRQFIATPTGFQKVLVGGMATILFPDVNFRSGSSVVVFSIPEGAK
jgi:alcohol dehydrogenase (cytochrome c)